MAVYWIGQDSNVYLKGDDGNVRNMGPSTSNVTRPDASGFYDPFADTTESPMRFNAQQIADPVANTTPAPQGGGGGGSPTRTPVFNQVGANNTQLAIDQIPALIQAALDAERTKYSNTIGDFNTQETGQRDQYGKSTVTNQKNYDSNLMDSVRGGVRGIANLMSLLRGTGAERQAEEIVGSQTSQDIRDGLDTREENQTGLDTTFSSFMNELDRKRKMAEDTRINNERAATRDYRTQQQDLYSKMAGFYSEADRSPEANTWLSRAGSLTPQIAADSRVQVSPYDTSPVVAKAPDITAFAAPKTQSVTYDSSNGQLGSGIFTLGENRRKKDSQLVGA